MEVDAEPSDEGYDLTGYADDVIPANPPNPGGGGSVPPPRPVPRVPARPLTPGEEAVGSVRAGTCDSVFLTDNAMIGDEVYCAPVPEPADGGEAPAAEPVRIVVTQRDFQNVPINPGGLMVQPDRGWVLINIETIVYTGAAEQVVDIEMLGMPVRVRATPVEYRWDFGEPPAQTTRIPGAPYPNHTVWHTYRTPTAEGETRQVTLTTVWQGAFSVDGGQWQLIDGTATTTQSSAPFEVDEARTSLTVGPGTRG